MTAVLFAAATVAAFFAGEPARIYLIGAIVTYGFGVVITTLEDLLDLLNAYWAARSADEWEEYSSSLSGRRSWIQRAVVRSTDKVFGPIGNDRSIATLAPPDKRVLDIDIRDDS